MRFDTRAIHGRQGPDPATGAVNVPVHFSTTFAQRDTGGPARWVYARTGNPTRAALEDALAALEGGARGLAFASGMAAIATLLENFGTGSRI
ncbi:MAG: PLP-dependent transferase, partial [Thermoplasmata archaeon]